MLVHQDHPFQVNCHQKLKSQAVISAFSDLDLDLVPAYHDLFLQLIFDVVHA